jgi:hypothetical protein
MPRIEVDEEEFRANSQLRAQIGAWMKNPTARRKLLEANKAFDPKAEIPELDQPDPLEQRVAPLAKSVEDLSKQLADEKASREQEKKLAELSTGIERGLDKLRREQHLTDEGVAAVRKIMEEEGITKPEIAWAHFVQLHPPQQLVANSGTGPGSWNFMEPPADDQADLKKLIESHGESVPVVDKLARDALSDIRGQSRR